MLPRWEKNGWARHKDVDDMVMLTLGTGVGGGIVLEGRIWHGMTRNGRRVRSHDCRTGRTALWLRQSRLRGAICVGDRGGANGERGDCLRARARLSRAPQTQIRSSAPRRSTTWRYRVMKRQENIRPDGASAGNLHRQPGERFQSSHVRCRRRSRQRMGGVLAIHV